MNERHRYIPMPQCGTLIFPSFPRDIHIHERSLHEKTLNKYYIQIPSRARQATKFAAIMKVKLICVEGGAAPFFDAVAAAPELLDDELFLVVVDFVASALTAFGVFVAGNRVVVLPSITTAVAPEAREIVCPSTVMMPPGVSVLPLITNVVPELAVKVWPWKVRSGGLVMDAGTLRSDVEPSITSAVAPAASEIVCPLTMMTPPGVRVCPEII